MGNVIILIFFLNFLFFYYLRQSVKTSNSRSSKIIMYFKIGIKYMLWYQDFGRKHPHAQQVFLLSLPLRSLDVISQGYLAVFLVFFFFFFFIKLWVFFDNVVNITFIFFFDTIAKHWYTLLLVHSQYPIFGKCLKYHSWYWYNLLITPPGPVDSLREKLLGYLWFCFG